MATKLPPAKRVKGRIYETFKNPPPKAGYTKGDVLKLGKNQEARFSRGLGWYAASKAKPVVKGKAGQGQVTGTVARGGGTLQNQTLIETPDQIEARVSRMAKTVFDQRQSDLDTQAELMRKEAEGRRLGMIDAYRAAATQNAVLGGQVQEAWTGAANNLAGIAGVTSGSIGDALQQDLASREAALSRVGAGGTGFDARSQANVEAFRGGVVPGEEFTRLGAVGNEYLARSAQNLANQGLQTGYAQEKGTIAEINAERLKKIAELGESRTEYESTLRKQFEETRAAQVDAIAEQQKLKLAADKQVTDTRMALAKLQYQYWNAKQSATTKKELAAVDMIYKQQKLALDTTMSESLINQRNASAAASNASAGLSNVKAAAGGFAPKTPAGSKPPSPTQVSTNVGRATNAGTQRLGISLDNIWDATPGLDIPADMEEDEYFATDKGKKALALYERKKTQAFGTVMGNVVKAITPHLKSVKYTPAQIRNVAYNIVSAKIRPPKVWPPKPKTPKKK